MRISSFLSSASVLAALLVTPTFAHAQRVDSADVYGAGDLSRPALIREPSAVAREIARVLPPSVRASRDSGTAIVEFVIDERGQVEAGSATVVDYSAPIFGSAAKAAVERLEFVPAQVKGHPARVRAALPFVFKP